MKQILNLPETKTVLIKQHGIILIRNGIILIKIISYRPAGLMIERIIRIDGITLMIPV